MFLTGLHTQTPNPVRRGHPLHTLTLWTPTAFRLNSLQKKF